MTLRIQDFNYDVDVTQALVWQYNEATNLKKLIADKQDFYDLNQTYFWTVWRYQIFWLYNDSLNQLDPFAFTVFGAKIWSFILNIALQIAPTAPSNTDIVWGLDGDETSAVNPNNFNFDNSTFLQDPNSVQLTIEQAVLVLKLRYYQLISRGSVTEINQKVCPLFEKFAGFTGYVYVLDNLNMTMTYVFTAAIPADLAYILNNYDILPRPAGVGLNKIVVTTPTFGFDGTAVSAALPNNFNFDNSTFFSEGF